MAHGDAYYYYYYFVNDDIVHENIQILFHPMGGPKEEDVNGINLKKKN